MPAGPEPMGRRRLFVPPLAMTKTEDILAFLVPQYWLALPRGLRRLTLE